MFKYFSPDGVGSHTQNLFFDSILCPFWPLKASTLKRPDKQEVFIFKDIWLYHLKVLPILHTNQICKGVLAHTAKNIFDTLNKMCPACNAVSNILYTAQHMYK